MRGSWVNPRVTGHRCKNPALLLAVRLDSLLSEYNFKIIDSKVLATTRLLIKSPDSKKSKKNN
jgi:hypothetical protein